MPLVAAFALAWRALRRRSDETPLGVWYVLILVGIVLSAGANTPLGHVLGSLPLYGGQRLQNRNAVIVDLALRVLLAVFVDVLVLASRLGLPAPGSSTDRGGLVGELTPGERLAGLLPLASWSSSSSPPTCSATGFSPSRASSATCRSSPSYLTPYFVATLLITVGAALLLVRRAATRPRRRRRLVTIVVLADVLLSVADGSYTLPAAATIAHTNAASTTLAKLLGPQGRYAIFNPAQSLPQTHRGDVIHELGPYDLDILHQLLSVQGTGPPSPAATKRSPAPTRSRTCSPTPFMQPILDILNLTELVTLPQYLVDRDPRQRTDSRSRRDSCPARYRAGRSDAQRHRALQAAARIAAVPSLSEDARRPGCSRARSLSLGHHRDRALAAPVPPTVTDRHPQCPRPDRAATIEVAVGALAGRSSPSAERVDYGIEVGRRPPALRSRSVPWL